MEKFYFFNDKISNISPSNLGENGFFETICIYKGKPLFLKDHLKRSQEGFKNFKYSIIISDIEKIFLQHISIFYNLLKSDLFRFRIEFDFSNKLNPFFVWSIAEKIENKICINEPISVDCCLYQLNAGDLNEFRNYKNKSRFIYNQAKSYAQMEGRFDSILVNFEKNISDSTICNVFAIKDNLVFTPPILDGALPGVLRQNIIKLLKNTSLKVQEKSISKSELLAADEVFLTNVIRGILPVNKINEQSFKIHKTTNKIQAILANKVPAYKLLSL